ncbi:DNA-binding protein [Micromonospora sp. LOL_024]|uniref:DNA-binding protein n=1 Tax=Micromonospora sp. LOL_024 TaxID=3345412 RepID=UPI003A877848
MDSSLDTLPKISAPATRALNAAGYTALRQLAGVPRAELARLHGMGPKALDIIDAALEQHNLGLSADAG